MASTLSRRSFIRASAGALASAWVGGACGSDPKTPLEYAAGQAQAPVGLELSLTPACAEGDAPITLSEIEGPYYTQSTPRRTTLLEPSSPGRRLRVVGRVVDSRCQPIPGAVLDFWQADSTGVYDNDGFRFRGHQFSDPHGLYSLETVVPGAYSAGWLRRTPHLHVKAQGASTRLLTTQLYMPEFDAQNRDDSLFHPELVMSPEAGSTRDAVVLRFDFVLSTSAA